MWDIKNRRCMTVYIFLVKMNFIKTNNNTKAVHKHSTENHKVSLYVDRVDITLFCQIIWIVNACQESKVALRTKSYYFECN